MRALEFLKFNIFIHAHHTQLKNALKSFNITVHDEVPPCGTVVAIAGSYHNKIHKLQSAFHNVYILVKTLNIYLLCAYSALLVQCYPHVCLMMKGFLLFQSRALCVMWTLISFFLYVQNHSLCMYVMNVFLTWCLNIYKTPEHLCFHGSARTSARGTAVFWHFPDNSTCSRPTETFPPSTATTLCWSLWRKYRENLESAFLYQVWLLDLDKS